MLTINHIRENREETIKSLRIRGFTAVNLIDEVIEADDRRRTVQKDLDSKQAELNALSKEIGILIRNKNEKQAKLIREKTLKLKEEIKVLNLEFTNAQSELKDLLKQIPNIPHKSVQAGIGPESNEIIRPNSRSKLWRIGIWQKSMI